MVRFVLCYGSCHGLIKFHNGTIKKIMITFSFYVCKQRVVN